MVLGSGVPVAAPFVFLVEPVGYVVGVGRTSPRSCYGLRNVVVQLGSCQSALVTDAVCGYQLLQ